MAAHPILEQAGNSYLSLGDAPFDPEALVWVWYNLAGMSHCYKCSPSPG